MALNNMPLLSILIWLPIIGGFLLLLCGERHQALAKNLAVVIALLVFGVSAYLVWLFDKTTAVMQFVERHTWIQVFNIEYYLGIDGIALPLILLTTFVTILVLIACREVIQNKVTQYLALFLIMEGLILGVFVALDAILFYIFFEAMLIPMFLIIGIWGGPNRVYATIKFFLYTFLGSVLMLVALLYLYTQTGETKSFAISDFHWLSLSLTEQIWIFLAFLIAFGVKVPMWPVHTWLPDAHVEAPTGGSVILAAITLKIGGYGFLRFALPITPNASAELAILVISLSLVAIVYIGFVALAQQDMKKLIAYSSIAHMGFVTLGLFVVLLAVGEHEQLLKTGLLSMQGAAVQMISHGFISAALFLCIGVLYDRMHSREIQDYGGVANTMPLFAVFMVLFGMANAGLPGTSGFVGEFMVILGAFQVEFWYAFLAATTLILGAAYTLWLLKRVMFGEVVNEKVQALQDLQAREFGLLLALAVLVIGLGVWPQPLLQIMEPSMLHLLEHILARV